ncbi:MAG: ylxRQ [Cyanobacteria bacterium RYN_339]|nr:ylxRQ [Cyanobacteria bacterium RYN_339]
MTKSEGTRVQERQCVACRALSDRTGLVRLVRLPTGEVVLDLDSKLHGRGAYACRKRTCLDQAARKGGFARSLRKQLDAALVAEVLAMTSTTEPSVPPIKGTN